jgi:hypothetical protein
MNEPERRLLRAVKILKIRRSCNDVIDNTAIFILPIKSDTDPELARRKQTYLIINKFPNIIKLNQLFKVQLFLLNIFTSSSHLRAGLWKLPR